MGNVEFNENRYVIKLGSSTVVDADDNLRTEVLDSVARQVSQLIDEGSQIAVVTSGAVALGRKEFGIKNRVDIITKQTLAGAGSVELYYEWKQAFKRYGKIVVQHLLSGRDVEDESRDPLMRELNDHSSVPVINANDAVNTYELEQLSKSGDNDHLAAHVAKKEIGAGRLILLTEAEGVWDRNRRIIRLIESKNDLIRVYLGAKSNQGTGGIESKVKEASEYAVDGRTAWITNTDNDSILRIARGEQVGTRISMH